MTHANSTGAVETAARRALAAYTTAIETGDPAPLTELLDETAEVMTTIPDDHGYDHGPNSAQRIAHWRHDERRLRGRLTLDGFTLGRRTAAFEYRLTGTLSGEPYRTHAAVIFELDGQRITGLREYYGDNTLPAEFFARFGLEEIFTETDPGYGETHAGKPPTLAATAMRPQDPAAQDLTARAFDGFALSVEHGDWEPFMALLADDVTFTLPIPGRWRGWRQGAEHAREYHRWRWQDLRMRAPVVTGEATFNGPTGAFGFSIDGTIGRDMRVSHPALYVLEAVNGQIVGFREYNGAERPTE